jgi:hypothetical protein
MNKVNVQKIQGLQLHYTSCRYGLSGHAGFQTRAMSHGIELVEQRAVERLGIYQPPRNLPTEPNQEQIDNLFPKAYRSTYLETGRLAIIKSAYVGQDYTQRGGNYFSHALIIEDLPDNIWPVDLYEWEGWKDKLLPTEDRESDSFELPTVTLIPNEEAYAFTELQEFLNEENDRKNQLASMIQAVFMRGETSRNIVIREELETMGLFWIACLQKSFPPSHQTELGCSSYQFDPRTCLAINVTLETTDFALDENERKYQFYVFDFVESNHNSQAGSPNEYASTISAWMSEQPDRLQEFYEFTKQFKHDTLNNELVSMLHLFQLNTKANLALGEQDLVNILNFVSTYTKKEYLGDILQMIRSVVGKLTQSENSANLMHLTHFFIWGAITTNNREYTLLSYQFIIQLFDQALFNDNILIDEINALRSEAKKAFGASYNKDFPTLFLLESHWSKITPKIHVLRSDKLSLITNELIASIRALDNNVKVYENNQLRQFVKSAILANVPQLNQLEWLLKPFMNDYQAVANICTYVSQILANEVDNGGIEQNAYENSIEMFANFLGDMLKKTNMEYRFNVINTMKRDRNTWGVLETEWQYAIAKQRDKVAAHVNYSQHVLQDGSKFSQHYQLVLSEELWKLLSKKEQLAQAITWIQDKQIESFPNELVNAVLQAASENISFDPEISQSDDLYEKLDEQVKSRNVVLCPNRLALRDIVLKASEKKFVFDKESIQQIQSALKGVDHKTYQEFTQIYLCLILTQIHKEEQHGLIIKAVFFLDYLEIFKQSYGLFYDKRPSKQFDNADMAALMFWLCLKGDDKDYQTFQLIQESALELLSSRIAKLKDDKYQVLLRRIEYDRKIKQEARKKWAQIYSQAEENRNTWFGGFLRKWRK